MGHPSFLGEPDIRVIFLFPCFKKRDRQIKIVVTTSLKP